jgi:outer membrane protein assembly factor BamB
MRVLTSFALCLALALAPCAGIAQQKTEAARSEWSQFRGNPRLTGVADASVSADLKLAWTYEAGEPIESSAAIAGGVAYVGSESGELHAVELATGKPRWKYKAGHAFGESSPAVSGGIVYIGDLAGTLHAVNAADGKAAWTFKSESEIRASPVVADGKVLFGSYDENFYALNARTGALLWKVQTNGPVHSTAAISEGLAYISGCDENFRAIRITDGKEMYVIASGAYTGASPAIEGKWAFYGTFNNDVLGVDLTARRVAWRYEHPDRQFPFYASAAVADGRVVVGGRDKTIHALDARTGKALWTFATRARVDSSAAIAGGRVYVGSNDGRFYVLDLAKGTKLWEFTAGAPLSASPAIAEGYVVIGAQDGRLYAFR